MASGVVILNGAVSKRGGEWRQYHDILRLRTHMDVPRYQFELAFHLIILDRSIPNRSNRRRRLHLHLHRLRCHLGAAFHRDANQRIHPHPFVRIRPVSTRHFRPSGGHQRATLRLIGLRTDVDAEARVGDVVGRRGIGDGRGDDGDDAGASNHNKNKRRIIIFTYSLFGRHKP